jgi:transcriptional regulator with PAS, ATPase and Fis domain
VRQLRNVTEQMSLIEKERTITKEILANYLVAPAVSNLPALMVNDRETSPQFFERELIYKFLTDLTKEVAELKKLVHELKSSKTRLPEGETVTFTDYQPIEIQEEVVEEEQPAKSLSLNEIEKEMIRKALDTFGNNRNAAAKELGISERTLYRKIKEYEM